MSKDPVRIAQDCLYEGTESLFKTFPLAIKRIINEKLWSDRTDRNGKPFKSFESFATSPLWHGLEIKSMSRLVEYIKEDAEAVKLVQAEMGQLKDPKDNPPGPGRGNKTSLQCNDVLEKGSRGNKAEYLLRRLKRDAPEIANDYIDGKYPSVRQAAIAAGIVKVPTKYETALKATSKLSRTEWLELRSYMDNEFEIAELN